MSEERDDRNLQREIAMLREYTDRRWIDHSEIHKNEKESIQARRLEVDRRLHDISEQRGEYKVEYEMLRKDIKALEKFQNRIFGLLLGLQILMNILFHFWK